MPLTKPQYEVFTNPTRFRVIVAGRRFGKLFSPNTDILTKNRGWIKFGDIRVGDKVFDENGNECNVTNIAYPDETHSGKMYRIGFEGGVELDTCADHKWVTWTHQDRKQFKREHPSATFPPENWASFSGNLYDSHGNVKGKYGPRTKTTQEIVDTLKVGTREDNNHSIPNCGVLDFEKKELPIDPYLFGYFLGDGTVRSGLFTIDQEDQKSFVNKTSHLGFEFSYRKQEKYIYLKGFIQKLKEHGLENKDIIPDCYYFCSAEQRLELLKGLMDSDGYNNGRYVEFVAKRKQHAELVHYLLVSLGNKARVTEKESKLYGKPCGSVYRVISNPSVCVFSLPRKADKFVSRSNLARQQRRKHRMIRSCEQIPWVEGSLCITVDSPNHMYLIGKDLIPTHNSILCLNELIRAAQTGRRQNVYYVAPTLKMARGILWPQLKDAIPQQNISSKNEQEMTIILKGYESMIKLCGADNEDALRGISVSFLVVDEVQDVPMSLIDMILRPAMGDQQADGLYIGTPKGKGENTAYVLYLRGKSPKYSDWQSWHYTTEEGGNVPKEEIEAARAVMSKKAFEQEFMASFITMQGRVYHGFHLEENISEDIEDRGGTIHIGMDFNVSPMTAVIGQKVGKNKLEIFDEISIEDSNTEEMCSEIKSRYPDRHIVIYPDASGGSRRSSAPIGQTDHTIMKDHKYGFCFDVIAPAKNPPIVDRVNDVNALLCSANGERNLLINPKCEHLIKCLDGQTYKEGTSIPDKTQGLDHANDALGYLVSSEFSIIKREVQILSLDYTY